MNLTSFSLKNPYGVIALVLVVVALGTFAFFRTPTDLFPDSTPPQVVVVTVMPGATATDIADKITQVLEKELNTISGLKRIVSTSRDEVSSINAEFLYSKSIDAAVVDVQNAIARVRAALPAGIQEPRLYRITDATRPLLTLALSPKKGSPKDLKAVRLLAENEIEDALLRIPGVGDVDVFGAHEPAVEVRVDRDRLRARGMSLGEVLAAIARQNVAAPAGTLYTDHGEYLIKVEGEFLNLTALRELPVRRTRKGQILLQDIAEVRAGEKEIRSVYHGNGVPAIAVNVMRQEGGDTVATIHAVKKALPGLEARYPDIRFEITNDQQPIIDVNVHGMRASVWEAVLMTVFVIFAFLADTRAALVVATSIPLSFLTALVVLWFSPYTLNMVTLSGLIIAVGMVVDASVVVLENIYRHLAGSEAGDAKAASLEGTREVTLAITAGMLTTVIVLFPVMFTGGYTQQIMRPLNMMIAATLVASLLVSLTVIPLVASRLLARPAREKNRLERLFSRVDRAVEALGAFYVAAVGKALQRRFLVMGLAVLLLVVTMRVVRPLNGGELMPFMDTGIGLISLDMPTEYTPKQVEEVLSRVEGMIREESPGLKWISSTAGSEPGQVSFGGGGATAQSVGITVTLVDRTQRKETIWEIEDRWRKRLRAMPGVRTFRVSEYGATPLSTTKAPLDIIISGPDVRVLDALADRTMAALNGIPGLTDVRRTWYRDKPEQIAHVSKSLARLYGTSPEEVAGNLRIALKGVPASQMRLSGALDIPIRVQYRADQIQAFSQLGDIDVPTRYGPIPFRALATVKQERLPPFVTREDLLNTIDITGVNRGLTIAQVGKMAAKRVKGIHVPRDYSIQVSGTIADMKEGNQRMGRALAIGLVLLYILLVAMFKHFGHPVTIMASIPFAVAGGMWGLLLFNKPMCKPAMMGMILLGGTIVNNAILMLDFILEARRKGLDREEAIVQSVRLRLRPILMTATSTIIGFTPLIFEMAVGLERMSPLGIVAAAGLLVGTVVTMVLTPVIYTLLDDLGGLFARGWARVRRQAAVGTAVLLLLAAPFLSAPRPAAAAEGGRDEAPTMTLQEAVDYALVHSPELAAAAADVKAAEGEKGTARSALLPQIDLSGGISYSRLDHGMIANVAPDVQGFSDTLYQGRASLHQLLWDFGEAYDTYRATKEHGEAAGALLERRRKEVFFRVAQLYLETLTDDDLLEAQDERIRSLEELQKNMESRLAQGRVAKLDVLKVKVRLAELVSQKASLTAQRKTHYSLLLAAMGYEGEVPPSLARAGTAGEEPIASGEGPGEVDEASLLEEAARQRLEIVSREHLLAAATYAEKAARSSRWPVLQAFGDVVLYGALDPKRLSVFTDQGEPDDWEHDYEVGVTLKFPLFDSGRRGGEIRKAQAEAQRARAEKLALFLRVQQEVRTALARLQAAGQRLEATRSSVEESREALRVEKLKYEQGRSIINDVLDAEAAALTAESLYKEARMAERIERLALELALGRLQAGGPPERAGSGG